MEASVSFTKGCYTGQELVARIDSRGSNVPRNLRGLRLSGPAAPGERLYRSSSPGEGGAGEAKEVGRLTSVARSPQRGWVALGYVARAVAVGESLMVAGGPDPAPAGGPARRGRERPARCRLRSTCSRCQATGVEPGPGPPPGRGRPPMTLSGQARAFDALAMYSFVALGLPDGMIGTAWPAVRRGFHAPLEDLGIVLLVATLGAIASSSVAGLLLGRLGIRRMIMLAGTIASLGAVGIILSPALWVFVMSGTGIGVAAGFLDSSVNTAVALANRNRLLNMLHGFYGVGSTIGPLVITAALLAGSWRPGYGVLLAVELVMVAGWWSAGRRVAPARPAPQEGAVGVVDVVASPPPEERVLSRSRMIVTVALGLVVFMVYTGFEVSAGQWEPSFDRPRCTWAPGQRAWLPSVTGVLSRWPGSPWPPLAARCRKRGSSAGAASPPWAAPPWCGGAPPRWPPWWAWSSSEAPWPACSRPWSPSPRPGWERKWPAM